MSPFESCRQRVFRANNHREAVAELWHAFLEAEPYRFRTRIDENGTGGLWIEQVKSIPDEVGLILGEMLYQLRAALDGIIYESAVLIHKSDPPPNEHALMFPIYDDSARFKKKTGYLAKFPQELRDVIESVQPYNVPKIAPGLMIANFNRTLAFINDWARKDRHRRLHVVGSFIPSVTPCFAFRVPPDSSILKSGSMCFWKTKQRSRTGKSRDTQAA